MVEAGPLVADSGVCCIQCFDTDGWVAGISSVLKKKLILLIHKGFLLE